MARAAAKSGAKWGAARAKARGAVVGGARTRRTAGRPTRSATSKTRQRGMASEALRDHVAVATRVTWGESGEGGGFDDDRGGGRAEDGDDEPGRGEDEGRRGPVESGGDGAGVVAPEVGRKGGVEGEGVAGNRVGRGGRVVGEVGASEGDEEKGKSEQA